MAVADFVAEFFETELLRAVIASRGIFGTALGPWSAGSTAVLLLRAAADPHPVGSATFSRVRPRHFHPRAGCVRQAGRRGNSHRSGSAAHPHQRRRGHRRRACQWRRNLRRRGGLRRGPQAHIFSISWTRRSSIPHFALRIRNIRANGTVAKVNFALGELPAFPSLAGTVGPDGFRQSLSGRIHIGPEIDYLERAFDASKYGEFSTAPYLELTIPSLLDPSLAPAGKHVVSAYVQFAPYKLKKGTWDTRRKALGDAVIKTIAEYSPNFADLVEASQIITPLDLETTYGFTGGHIFHGELALDQLFTMRPVLDWARYKTPIRGLFLCGSGTHPGNGLTGASGANAAREIIRELR